MRMGFLELACILGAFIFFFGKKKIPELARATKEAKKILKEDSDSDKKEDVSLKGEQQEDAVNEQ